MLKAVNVPINRRFCQVGCAVLVQGNAVPVAFGPRQRRVDQPPCRHALRRRQVWIAHGKAKERAAIPRGLGQPHACQFGFNKERQVSRGLEHLVGHLPEVYMGCQARHHPLMRPPGGSARVGLNAIGDFAIGRVNTPDNRGIGANAP